MLSQGLHRVNVLQMFSPGCAVNQYVVEEYKDKYRRRIQGQISSKNVVHERLKGGWCIGQSERHHQELIVPMMSSERCLPNVSGVHPHLMIARPKIEFDEELGTMQLVKQLHHRNRKLILDSVHVQSAIIHAKSPCAVLLLHQEHR
uniref:Uncharacterized protein n=1 Tax=Arundo donax TaxID=35708 RepID=A0A0A9A462_ARUDO